MWFGKTGQLTLLILIETVGLPAAPVVSVLVTFSCTSMKPHWWHLTTGAAGKPAVSIKINSVSWPVFPNHTSRSIYINQQALPLLQGETMQLQATAATKLINISGASQTTTAWKTSLQAALLKSETP